MYVIKTIEEPQDIYIIGCHIKGREEDFSLTDDYCSLRITDLKNKKYIDTDGFVQILTHDELIGYKDQLLDDESNLNQGAMILMDFSGQILVGILRYGDGLDLTPSEYDKSEYAMYQRPDGEDDIDIVLQLPLGTFGQTMSIEKLLEKIF